MTDNRIPAPDDISPVKHTVIVLQDEAGLYYEKRVLKSERDKYPRIDYEKAYAPEAQWK